MDANHESPKPWLWVNRHGGVSCGAVGCITAMEMWHVLNPVELAELGALATARRTILRCKCGAVEYDPASRTVRGARPERETP